MTTTTRQLYNTLTENFYYHTDGELRRLSDHTAVGSQNQEGYKTYKINKKTYGVHSLIYLICNGKLPKARTDHKDRDPFNNKVENLRPATCAENSWNTTKYKNNTSGVKGVDFYRGKWRVRVMKHGKRHSLGSYKEMVDAVQVRVKFVEEQHGDFACHG